MRSATRPVAILAGLAGTAGLLLGTAPVVVAQSAPLAHPVVINGTPNSPLAGAAIALRMGDFGWCTGTLWQPRIVITAAHCVVDGGRTVTPVEPGQVVVYPPGGDQRNGRSDAKVTHIVYDQEWAPITSSFDGSQIMPVEQDIAFLILDRPLGQPIWTRMATAAEVAQLAAQGSTAEYVGYGLTAPKADPSAQPSPVPMSLRMQIDPSNSTLRSFYSLGDGVSGNCSGDSGGPLIAQIGTETVYVGPVTRVAGPPCIGATSSPVGSSGLVASERADLAAQALGIVQAAQATRTCIVGPEVDQECWQGSRWTYAYCWSGRKAALQRMESASWVTIARYKGKRSGDCDRDYPYLIEFTRRAEGSSVEYRLYVPKQSGIANAMTDPFTVTASERPAPRALRPHGR